jgi:hypothetical protein
MGAPTVPFFLPPLYVNTAQWNRQRSLPAVVATSPTTSTFYSHSMLNKLRNRYTHCSYNACELSTAPQDHHGLFEHVLLHRRTPCFILKCFQWDGRSNRGRDKILSLLQILHTSPGAHPAFCSMGTGRTFAVGKAARHEADHPPPSSVKVTNEGSCTSAPPKP